jgi:hemoglobin/transferrin/lactoferrin receptor protein
VFAGLENMLDKRYRPYSSGISAPGRNFVISLHAKI